MNRLLCIVIGIIVTSMISCHDNGSPIAIGPPSDGRYSYTGYDLSGTEIGSGILSLNIENGAIAGQKDIVGDTFEAGRAPIGGFLLPAGEIYLRLSPSVALKGRMTHSQLTGDRLFDTGASPHAPKIGTFRMVHAQ